MQVENEKYMARIYSFNLIAYLIRARCEMQGKFRDIHNGRIYYVFAENEKTAMEIKNYKEDAELHEFLNIFRDLKLEMKNI